VDVSLLESGLNLFIDEVCLSVCLITGEIVKASGPGVCETCELNEGVCHLPAKDDVNNDGQFMCSCPVSRVGEHCETIRGSALLFVFQSVNPLGPSTLQPRGSMRYISSYWSNQLR